MATPATETPVATPPAPGTPEHDAAMIAVADKAFGTPATPEPAKRPDHVPEKFWDAEKGVVRVDDVLKSYTELERKQGTPPAAKPAVVETPAKEPTLDEQKAFLATKGVTAEEVGKLDEAGVKAKFAELNKPATAAAAVTAAGLDMAALNAEFAEKGDLSPETRAKLETAGYPKEMVDSYIAGQKALATEYQGKAEAAAGGKDKLTAILAWAGQNIAAGEAKAFNEATASGDVDRMSLAIAGLRSRFEAANGSDPALLRGGAPATDTNVFKSNAEVVTAMRDPRYKTDPAYRKTVEDKVGRSNY